MNRYANAVFTIFAFNFLLVCTFLHHICHEEICVTLNLRAVLGTCMSNIALIHLTKRKTGREAWAFLSGEPEQGLSVENPTLSLTCWQKLFPVLKISFRIIPDILKRWRHIAASSTSGYDFLKFNLQTSVYFRNFAKLYLCSLKTYESLLKLVTSLI